MGRAKLPEARIEPRGVEGHLAQLKAQARQRARVAGAAGIVLARIFGWTAFAVGTVAALVWLAPPPSNPRLDEIKRIQADFQRYQTNMMETQRALEQMQRVDQARLMETLRVPTPGPFFATSAPSSLSVPAFDWSASAAAMPAWPPEPASSYSQPSATKAERAAARAAAVEHKRAERTAGPR